MVRPEASTNIQNVLRAMPPTWLADVNPMSGGQTRFELTLTCPFRGTFRSIYRKRPKGVTCLVCVFAGVNLMSR
jgi:hypothetical protein